MRFYYEGNYLFWIGEDGKAHPPKKRHHASTSIRCEDCDLRNALTHDGVPKYCSECRSSRSRGKKRCLIESCSNGCEACGGTGRVSL